MGCVESDGICCCALGTLEEFAELAARCNVVLFKAAARFPGICSALQLLGASESSKHSSAARKQLLQLLVLLISGTARVRMHQTKTSAIFTPIELAVAPVLVSGTCTLHNTE
jgi:hypothetical protein